MEITRKVIKQALAKMNIPESSKKELEDKLIGSKSLGEIWKKSEEFYLLNAGNFARQFASSVNDKISSELD